MLCCGAAPAGAAPHVGAQKVLWRPGALPADFYPGKGFRKGRPIPRGYAVVLRRAVLRPGQRARTRLTCPAGYRMRNLATSGRISFLVVRADRDYFLRRRTVRMDLGVGPLPPRGRRPTAPEAGTAAAARPVRGIIAGLCRRSR